MPSKTAKQVPGSTMILQQIPQAMSLARRFAGPLCLLLIVDARFWSFCLGRGRGAGGGGGVRIILISTGENLA